MKLAVLADDLLYCLLKRLMVVLGRQRQDVSSMSKELVADATIELQALWDRHAQSCEHH